VINILSRLPAAAWLKQYNVQLFGKDLTAAIIVTVLLIPQSLAYAMLAGVPPEVGLYSSIMPLVLYALIGSSTTLSVGPVAVASLMTATALGSVAAQGTADYVTAAVLLALLSGLFLVVMGFLKLGFVTNFLSHSVISGFISASGILIGVSQLKHIFGTTAHGDTLVEIVPSLLSNLIDLHILTLIIGVAVIAFLWASRRFGKSLLASLSVPDSTAGILTKTAPIVGVLLSLAAVYFFNLDDLNVNVVGDIPSGLPVFTFAIPSMELIQTLALPAFMISIIGYVESISVGKTLASKRREKISPNQELVALGSANLASGFSGGFPVTGGFSRSVVNFDAGAATQMAGILAAVGIALASIFLTPILYYLPKATLAATIIIAVTSLIDFSILKKTWTFAKSDFYAVMMTIVSTLLWGVEVGVTSGVGISVALHIYRTSKPHIAEVGLIKGSKHFRNVLRHDVTTLPNALIFRPDESLMFSNATYLEELVTNTILERAGIQHVVLQCSAINQIDFSALEMLEHLNEALEHQHIKLHLSEVKGPVMDNLSKTGLLDELSGKVFTSQFDAFLALSSTPER